MKKKFGTIGWLIPITITIMMILIPITSAIGQYQQQQQHDYQILWSRDWFDGDIRHTRGGKAATDSDNNVIAYVRSGAASEQYVILKYDVGGNPLWEVPVDTDGLDNIESVDLELYVEEPQMPIGYEGSTNNMTQINGNIGDSWFYIRSICTDESNNIILVCDLLAQTYPSQQRYVVVFKYDQNGNEMWKNKYDYNDMLFPGRDSVVDSDGSIFIPCTNLIWSYVLKLESDGSVDWIKPIRMIPFWWAQSVVLDSNENPVVSAIYCVIDPYDSTMPIGLTKFNGDTGNKIADGVMEVLLRGTEFHDVALAIDTSDNSVFFGFIDYIYKIDASFSQIIWQKHYTCYINDLKVSDEKLIACGGWCSVNDVLHYYGAVYNIDSGNKLLDIALGEILYSDDPFFQDYFNQLQGMSIDSNGDVLFAGGQGGIRTVKVRITSTGIPNIRVLQEQIQQL